MPPGLDCSSAGCLASFWSFSGLASEDLLEVLSAEAVVVRAGPVVAAVRTEPAVVD